MSRQDNGMPAHRPLRFTFSRRRRDLSAKKAKRRDRRTETKFQLVVRGCAQLLQGTTESKSTDKVPPGFGAGFESTTTPSNESASFS